MKIEKGFIPVDRRQRTNVPGIYAMGDLVGQPMLAHKTSKEAEVVAEVIAGHKAEMDARCIPAVIFTDPEVASAGVTAEEAEQRGRKVKIGKFPFAALDIEMGALADDIGLTIHAHPTRGDHGSLQGKPG